MIGPHNERTKRKPQPLGMYYRLDIYLGGDYVKRNCISISLIFSY